MLKERSEFYEYNCTDVDQEKYLTLRGNLHSRDKVELKSKGPLVGQLPCGSHRNLPTEAVELRDGNKGRHLGNGVMEPVENVNTHYRL